MVNVELLITRVLETSISVSLCIFICFRVRILQRAHLISPHVCVCVLLVCLGRGEGKREIEGERDEEKQRAGLTDA